MIPVLASVFVISMSGALMPGPMFAVVLAKSYRSPWAGTQVSLGHAVIEFPIIMLIYFGFAAFFESNIVQLALSLVGGAMIIWMGWAMFSARQSVVREGKDVKWTAFTAGIITSGLNPFFLVWWATVGSMLIARIVDYGLGGLAAFTITHWLVDLIWLSFVSFIVFRTHNLWSTRFQEAVFILNSLLLIGFGFWFMISGVQLVL
jgi:threonine/homoserine/homoserine lactone efflux protein